MLIMHNKEWMLQKNPGIWHNLIMYINNITEHKLLTQEETVRLIIDVSKIIGDDWQKYR